MIIIINNFIHIYYINDNYIYIYDSDTGRPLNLNSSSHKKPDFFTSRRITDELRENPNDLDAHVHNVAYLLMQECNVNSELLEYLKSLGSDSSKEIPYLEFKEFEHIKHLIEKNPKTDEDLAIGINNEINKYLRLKFPSNFSSKSIPFLESDSEIKSEKPKIISDCPSSDKTPTLSGCVPWRKQALVFHPDKNPGCRTEATKKFQYFQKICPKNGGKKCSNKKRSNKKRSNKKRSNKKRSNKKRTNKKNNKR